MEAREELQQLRNKMIFQAYGTKDLDVIERAFHNKYNHRPDAYMSRSPFGVRGNVENRRKLVLSNKHCGANVIFVPLKMNKKQLEETIMILGDVKQMIYVDRRKIEKHIELAEKKQEAHRTYVRHCPYCGTKYITDVVNPKPSCGSFMCKQKHSEHTEIEKELRKRSKEIGQQSKVKKTTTMPTIELDSPAHNTLQGYVYCVRAENGLCKIGRSDDVENRFANLVTMSPVSVWLEHTVFSDNYVLAESYAHLELAEYRHHGEWFNLPDEVREWFLSLDNYDLDVA